MKKKFSTPKDLLYTLCTLTVIIMITFPPTYRIVNGYGWNSGYGFILYIYDSCFINLGLLSLQFIALGCVTIIINKLLKGKTLQHDGLLFSKTINFDGHNFTFKIQNKQAKILFNPKIRVSVVEHCDKNQIPLTILAKIEDTLLWLDNNNQTILFPDNINNSFFVSEEWKESKKNWRSNESSFAIKISVSGSYNSKNYTQIYKYSKEDIIKV